MLENIRELINEWFWLELLVLNNHTWNNLTVCKQIISGSFKDVTKNTSFIYIYIYIYIYILF